MKRDGLFPALFPRSRARRLRQTEIDSQDAKLSPEPRSHDETDYAKIIEKADRCRDALQYAEAAEAYSAAIELAPFRTDIRVQHANMLKEMGRLAEAKAAYREALARAPARFLEAARQYRESAPGVAPARIDELRLRGPCSVRYHFHLIRNGNEHRYCGRSVGRYWRTASSPGFAR
jgi:tetratricopeptide (TPR) repeat protein